MSDFAGGAESNSTFDAGQSAASAAPSTAAPSVSQSTPQVSSTASQSSQSQPSSFSQPSGPSVRQNGQTAAPQASFQQAQQPAQQQFQGQSAGVLAALKASGYDVSGFNDDSQFMSALDSRLSEANTYKQQVEDYQRQLAARGQPIPGQFERIQEHLATPVEAKNGWNPPQYDARNDQFFRFDEQSKRYVPNQPNVPYELVQAKNDYMDYRAAFAKEWSDNPVETLWSRTEDRNRALIREEMTSLFKQMQVTKETNDWLETNKEVLFVDGHVDHSGDPAKLTQAGQLALQATEELDKAGVQDPAARRSLTEKFIAAELSKQYLQQQQVRDQDPANRRYTINEITQAFRAAQGLPPEQPQQQAPQQQQFAPQQQPQMPGQVQQMPQGWPQQQQVAQQAPQQQFAPPMQYQQPQQPMMPPQFLPPQQYQQPQYAPVPPGYQQGYAQAPYQPQMTPEQINEAGKRRFVGGVGHNSSAGAPGAATGEFVPQANADGKPNFLNIYNQIAQARGITL